MPTCTMQGKLRGLTKQFMSTNVHRPDDDLEEGDMLAWDNRCYVMKHQLQFSEVHTVT